MIKRDAEARKYDKKLDKKMKTLYVECNTGIAGDMFAGALYDLIADDGYLAKLQGYMPENVVLSADKVVCHGLSGTRFIVKNTAWHEGHHHGHSVQEVLDEIQNTGAPVAAKSAAKGVYAVLADAEAKAHNVSLTKVHFHEVGELRASMAVLCSAIMLEKLKVKRVVFSPINTGYGTVLCDHGEMKVPTPATANILDGVPAFCVDGLTGELCTPTGAALAKYYAKCFDEMPDMETPQTGVGIGGRDIGIAGGVKVFLGEVK